MLVLALDTATPASTAALVEVDVDTSADRPTTGGPDAGPVGAGPADAGRLGAGRADAGRLGAGGAGAGALLRGIAEHRTVDPRAHGEKLAPAIAAVLSEAGVRARDLGAIVAGLGPGPYTGLRVGLVTAAGMGQALGVPTYGVCSLDGIGRAAGPGHVLVATDARRREVYFATYVDGVRESGPDVARPADVVEAAKQVGQAWKGAGEGVLKYADIFDIPVEEHLLYPPGVALVALAAERIVAGAPSEVLTPLYLRRPDAVEPAGRKPVLT